MLVLQVGERKLQAGSASTFSSATWEPPGTSRSSEPGTSGSHRPGTSGTYKPGTSVTNKPGTSGAYKLGTSDSYKPPVSSSSTSKRTNKPPITSSSEGGLLGGSSVYLTSMCNHASSVLPAGGGGGISSVTSLPSSGGSLGGVAQAPSDSNGGFNIFPKGDPFAKYFRGSAHVSGMSSGSGGAGGATFPASGASTSRLESMLERITSLGNNGADTIIRPTYPTASVSGSSGFASGGNPAHITMATAVHSNTLSCGSYKPASATMVTRPGLSGGLDPRLVPDSMSQGMMGTGSGGMIPGSAASFLPQKYQSQ